MCTVPLRQHATYQTCMKHTIIKKTILAGDFNGHSPRWGYPNHNKTGKFLEELSETTNLSILQDTESAPTLLHRAHLTLSRPDLTICSSDLIDSCCTEVLGDIGSDHRPILTTIKTPYKAYFKRKTRWNFAKADWKLFQESSDNVLSKTDNTSVEVFSNEVTSNSECCITKHPKGQQEDIQTLLQQRNAGSYF